MGWDNFLINHVQIEKIELELKISKDISWMRHALTLAQRGIGTTHPNPRVGAVIVKNDKCIAEGWHISCGYDHAEIMALKHLANKGISAQGATLYVSLEPCHAQGRTPPCTTRIIAAGISRVVYASDDLNTKMAGGGLWLADQGLEIVSEVLKTDADVLNSPFFHYLKYKRPFITAKAAISLDGKLATASGDSKWITGIEARQHAHGLRAEQDAIIVGAGTLIHDNPSLNVRHGVSRNGTQPLRVAWCSRLPKYKKHYNFTDNNNQNSPNSRLYTHKFSSADNNQQCQDWQKNGVEVVQVSNISAMFTHLAKDGYLAVMVEGGGHLHASLLRSKLIDRLVLYQAPILIGGTQAIGLWHDDGINLIKTAPKLTNIIRCMLGNDQCIIGDILYEN
ncbi:MAG: bifunctional diaminohydroxyphosphoribosylaminopyrimidine deaminase/5-amino-6-(5-phosphoribosylamino)uracil reductase RibD [Mariprofundales bacterium]